MAHQLFNTLKRSPVIVQLDESVQQNWENTFHMAINIAKNCKCSFHLIDLNQVIERYLNWKILLPRVKPFFAHTFQRDPKIAYILGSLGTGFSCATFRECNDCFLNVPRLQNQDSLSKEIIINNPFKLGSDMKNCRKLGITMTTFMCKSELDRIKIHWPEAELLMSVIVNPQLCSHELTSSKLAVHPDQVDELLDHVKKSDLNLVGLLCYFGTNYRTVSNWSALPKIASEIIDKMEAAGFKIKILNLGDGFDYVDQENEEIEWIQFQEDLSTLNNELTEYFPITRGIEVIAQPCRYFTQKSELFAFRVMGKRIRLAPSPSIDMENENEILTQKQGVLIVENSQYMSFNFHRGRGHNFPNFWFTADDNLMNLALMHDESEILSTIYGFTCDSLDVIAEDFSMPESIAVGDFLFWIHRGAYGTCLMSQFNGMKPPKHFHFIKREMLIKFMNLCDIQRKEDLQFNIIES